MHAAWNESRLMGTLAMGMKAKNGTIWLETGPATKDFAVPKRSLGKKGSTKVLSSSHLGAEAT